MIASPRVAQGQTAQPTTVPPPIGGLNGRDPIASMDAADAYQLDNMFPSTAYVEVRAGCTRYDKKRLPGPVRSLEVYTGAVGDKMLAWASDDPNEGSPATYSVYDVSAPDAVVLASGLGSAYVRTAMFSNSADTAQRLIIVSGHDLPRAYDGSAYTALTITGVKSTPDKLNSVFAFKSRLYFGEENRLGFYYLPIGQIQGAVSFFDLGQVSRLGGKLVAIASYSDESGSTPDDYIVFITNKGECIVYAGYDPSSIASWALVGRYYAASPIGPKCTLNYGSELVILTTDGAISFSDIRRTGNASVRGVRDANYTALTSKLGRYLSDLNVNADVPGWSGIQYSGSTDGWLILNVPASKNVSGQFYQFVMNTKTNAWCRFTNWNGMCFAVYNRKLYFGRYDGQIFIGDEGTTDAGMDIPFVAKQAYNYFEDGNGIGFLTKHFLWASLLISCDGEVPLSGKFNTDYSDSNPGPASVASTEASGARWDVTKWDQGYWADEDNTQRFIITLNAAGVAGSLWISGHTSGQTFKWFATQYVMQKTKGLLI